MNVGNWIRDRTTNRLDPSPVLSTHTPPPPSSPCDNDCDNHTQCQYLPVAAADVSDHDEGHDDSDTPENAKAHQNAQPVGSSELVRDLKLARVQGKPDSNVVE